MRERPVLGPEVPKQRVGEIGLRRGRATGRRARPGPPSPGAGRNIAPYILRSWSAPRRGVHHVTRRLACTRPAHSGFPRMRSDLAHRLVRSRPPSRSPHRARPPLAWCGEPGPGTPVGGDEFVADRHGTTTVRGSRPCLRSRASAASGLLRTHHTAIRRLLRYLLPGEGSGPSPPLPDRSARTSLHPGGVDAGVHAAAPLVGGHDLADRDLDRTEAAGRLVANIVPLARSLGGRHDRAPCEAGTPLEERQFGLQTRARPDQRRRHSRECPFRPRRPPRPCGRFSP